MNIRKVTVILGLLAVLGLTACGTAVNSAAEVASPPAAATPVPVEIASPGPVVPTATQAPRPTATSSAPSPASPPDSSPAAPDSSSSPTTAPPEAAEIEHVLIISIDGLRPDALDRADTPTMDALRKAGAYSPTAEAVLPSVTLINHASMLSGMGPDKHGIDWNEHRPEAGKVKGPTVFSLAHEAGFSTAMVVGKAKLKHLVLPGSVDNYIYAGFLDELVVDQALQLIQSGLPDLLFIHLPDVDSAGHTFGWMSDGQLLVVSRTDGLISEVVAALEHSQYLQNTLLIISADHGGLDRAHGGDSVEETTVPWLAVGPGVPAGVILQNDIVTYDTAATILRALGLSLPPEWDGQPVLEIFGETVADN